VVIALLALPKGEAFFALDDLEQALFARIGERFSLSYDPPPLYSYNKDPEEVRRAEQEWRQQLRAEWLRRERPWVTAALITWLYYLGIVEIGLVGEQPVCVRLTDLGRAILSPESAATFEETRVGPAWLVQPDFEIVVYLDQAAPGQIAFVERHAERLQAQSHVARYRLTRESIYQGLEGGTTLDELLENLRAGAAHDLPQNVAATIREWAARREQITLHRRAQLLEFADQAARQRALDGGMAGTPVGERFVLFATMPSQLPAHTRIDYTLDLPRCLAVTEEGSIRLVRPAGDLLLHPQLGQWADVQPDGTWQLSNAGVAQAIRSGASISQLIGLLQARLTHQLPPLLGVVLRAWAGSDRRTGGHSSAALHRPSRLRGDRRQRPAEALFSRRAGARPAVGRAAPGSGAARAAGLGWAGYQCDDRDRGAMTPEHIGLQSTRRLIKIKVPGILLC
jgi:hypothetical protein